MANFANCVDHVLKVEGGYVNNPDDPGKETNRGITKTTALNAGYTGNMKDLTVEQAKQIYKKLFWDTMCLDQVEKEDIALEIFDSSVNIGPGVVAVWVQTILNGLNEKETLWSNLAIDGAMGLGTVGILNKATKVPETKVIIFNALNSFQTVHYFTLAKSDSRFKTFMYGWLRNRIEFED